MDMTTMFKFKFTARDVNGKAVKFSVNEPVGPNAYQYAWERAEKMAKRMGWTELKFRD
jgi:hypothetical protein